MLDPWDDDDMETPRKFSLSVDSTDGASGKKLQRKKKGTVNPRLRNSTARSSNLNQKDFNVREKKARQTKPPVPSFDDRENQPVRNNGNATPVGTQWSQHNKARPSYATVSVAETNTIRNAMPEMPERGVSAETRRTQEQLGSMMTFFQNSGSAGNQIVQSAGQENAQRTPMSVAQEEIHREITIKPWNSSPTQTGPAARTSSDSRKSSPVVAIVSRTKPKHHPAAEVDGVSEVTSADSSHTGTPAAPKSAQLQRLRADLDAERSRADAAEASVERLAAQILQRDRIAHVSNSPEPKHRSNSLMSSGSTDALEKLQAQILKNKNSDLELLVQDLMRENQELRAQQEKFMDSYEHNEQSVDRRRGGEAQAQIDQLRDQLSRQRQDFKAREAQLQSTQSEMREKHQDELQKQCSLLEKSHQECTDLRAAVQQLAAATAQDRARCRQLENQAVTQDGAVEETRALNQKLHDQQQKLRERCLALEVRLAEANKRVERATQEAESNHRKAENLSTHLMETKQAYTKIMSRVADLEQHNSQNDAQSAMIEGLQQQLMDTKQRLFAEEKRSTDLEIHCRELMARLKALAAREQEPSSMDRTSLSPSNDENHKIVASNAVGECMALRRQVQVLTRQVTELEEANTQLALIKTTQVCRVVSTIQISCVCMSVCCLVLVFFLTFCA